MDHDVHRAGAIELFEANKDWALRCARSARPAGILDREDLDSYALIGLWKAALRFQEDQGAAFRTYALHMIRGEIGHAYRDQSEVPGWAWEQGVRFQRVSLDSAFDDEGDREKMACLAVEQEMDGRIEAERLLSKLDPRTRRIVWAVANGYSRADCARELGISCNYAGLLYNRGIGKLRAISGKA